MSNGLSELRTVDLTPLAPAVAGTLILRDGGWQLHDDVGAMRLSRSGISDVQAALDVLEPLATGLVDVRAIGRVQAATFELRRFNGDYQVQSVPDVLPQDLFDDADLEVAARAWEREQEAVLHLPLIWSIDAELDLAAFLPASADLDFRVVATTSAVRDAFSAASLARLAELVPGRAVRRVYLAIDSSAEPFELGSVTFAGLMSPTGSDEFRAVLTVSSPRAWLPAERSEHAALAELPPPTSIVAASDVKPPDTWRTAVNRCEALAAVITWAMIASDVSVDGPVLSLEFRGFKRIVIEVDTAGTLPQVATDTRRLRNWAFQDASPDRLLALQQVTSLYEPPEALRRPDDVLDSAKVVFAGLRSEAVAEVVRGTREAYSQTLQAVQQTVRGVQDSAKSAGDRLLASLVALGAIVIANAGKNIDDDLGRDLMLVVAAFLVFLAFASLFLEGPILSLPLTKLREDIRRATPLLTAEQREELATLPSVKATQNRLVVLRVAIPTVYLVGVLLIVFLGHPSNFN